MGDLQDPAEATGLPEGVAKTARLKVRRAPCRGRTPGPWADGRLPRSDAPAGHGLHRYFFKLYALNTTLDVEPGLSKKELLEEMQGAVIGEGEWMGTYERR